jgi:hypothetical protein
VKIVVTAATISIAVLPITGANAREIMTHDEFNTVMQNAIKFAKRKYREGNFTVWEGEGYRARASFVDSGYEDMCFNDSDTERSCYDRDGSEWKMSYEGTEWTPHTFTRKRWPGEQPPDLFKK